MIQLIAGAETSLFSTSLFFSYLHPFSPLVPAVLIHILGVLQTQFFILAS